MMARRNATYKEFMPRLHLFFRAWRYRRKKNPGEIAFVRRLIGRGQIAIDVGAHKGAYTYWMDAQVGRGGRVFAFEPLPHLAGYLRDLQAAGALRHMTVVEAALSDHPGVALLFMPDSRHQGASTLEPQAVGHVQFRVHVETLTDFCARQGARPVHFIKADIEGYEFELFRGAEELLREDRPTLLFECVDSLRGGGQIGRVFGYLEGLGYEGYFFPKGRMEPVGNFRMEKHQKKFGPDWCMNFGFVAKERKLVDKLLEPIRPERDSDRHTNLFWRRPDNAILTAAGGGLD